MANEPEISPNGVFVDTQTNEIVYEKPEEGIQLVVPGGEIDSIARASIAAVNGSVGETVIGVPAVVEDVEPLEVAASVEDVEETVDEAKTVKSQRKPKA